jgi:sugar/nucleoside kinase (ribokinase family)
VAISFAQRAAAYSVTGRGAQASMPWLSDLV